MIRYILAAALCRCAIVPANAIERYQPGDTLYVWASSGLTLRSAPALNAGKMSLLPFGAVVVAQDYKHSARGDSIQVDAFKPLANRGSAKNPTYLIRGSWLKIRVNGQEGYVFDGFLSAIRPLFSEELLHQTNSDQSGSIRIFRNGVYCLTTTNEAGYTDKYVLPDADMTEGFLVANQLFDLEKSYRDALQDENGRAELEFTEDTLNCTLEYEVDGHYSMGTLGVYCTQNTVIIYIAVAHN